MNASLLEVLISLLLLSLVVLGVGTMQISSLHTSRSSYYLSTAIQEINNLNDYLQTSHSEDINEGLQQWRKQVAESLPQGVGVMEGSYPSQHVAIYWGGAMPNTCQKTHADTQGCLHFQG